MSNLIGPLLGNVLLNCTGMDGYCTVWVIVMETSEGKRMVQHLGMLGLTCEASCRVLHGSVYSKVHLARCIAQKFSRRGWALQRTGYRSPLDRSLAN